MTATPLPSPAEIAADLLAAIEAGYQSLQGLRSDVRHRPTADRWTIQEVIGHLIDSAANNHQRFVRAQFTDELIFPKYEQNQWVRCQAYDEAEWPAVLDLWRAYNRHLAHVIRNIDPEALDRRCLIGEYEPVSLHFLLADYVVHLKHHLQKIDERLP